MSDKYLVIMRGLVRESRHWGDYINKLQSYLPDHKILAPNIPGNGLYNNQKSITSISGTIDYVRQSIKKQIPEGAKVDLCAISLGGMVATAWLQKYPEDFNRAILMNTSYRGLTPIYKRMAIPTLFKLIQSRFAPSIRKKEEIIYGIVSNSPQDEKIISLWTKIGEENPVSTENALRQIWAASKFKPDLKTKPKTPILLLAGEKDRLCSVDCSKAIAKLWELPLETHPTAGHELHHDATEWTFNHLKNWLAQ